MDNLELIRSHVDVSLMLAKQVFSTEAKGDSNLVFSPLSINLILSLTAAGAATGPVRDELVAFLKSRSTDDLNAFYSQIVRDMFADGSASGGPRLCMVNGAWGEQTRPFKPSFKRVAERVYKAVCESVDFLHKAREVANQVNLWVEKETKGLIKDILPPMIVSERTRLILANALYFKGAWVEEFDEYYTKPYDFHLLDGSCIQVPFMKSYNTQCVKECNGFKALKLAYKQGDSDDEYYMRRCGFSMYIFLPDAKDGLPSLMHKACSQPGFLEQHLPKHAISLDEFRIPKFKLSFRFEASKVLKELGLVLPFEKYEGQGLIEMVSPHPVDESGLFISKIFHKSFIEVNEGGTEAAAATVEIDDDMGFSLHSPPPPEITFVADHPFLFFIREDYSGLILFMGTLLNPLSD